MPSLLSFLLIIENVLSAAQGAEMHSMGMCIGWQTGQW